ncbi:unnamed protein product [Paramecium sonneborni]|uniref:Uncharacterized protein n=1 Tax=Paramecium sonneborni TaxID=65129 RepID=A0A8S1PK98_9CILI|nr:unnamed protein product [Paramecium sonneborni]
MILQLEYGISNNVNSYQKDVRCVTFHAIIWVLLGSENQKARLLNLSKQISYSDFDRTYSSLNVLIFLSQKGFDFHMFMEL